MKLIDRDGDVWLRSPDTGRWSLDPGGWAVGPFLKREQVEKLFGPVTEVLA